MFKMMASVDMTLVPYLGSTPALADLIAGTIDAMFDPMPSSIAHIKAGKLLPLAVTSPTKSEALPDVPAASDFVPGYEAGSWFGVVAPRETPGHVIETLNMEINAAFSDPSIRARLSGLAASALPGSTAQFKKFVSDETERYARVIRSAKITPK